MLQAETHTTLQCYHCGETCADDHIHLNEKVFCCDGCKTVFEILDENGLCNYYDLEQSPGIQLKVRNWGTRYDFLDNLDIAHQLLDFAEGNTQKITWFVPAIHCSSCIWLLENLYKLQPGIQYSRVNFVRKEVMLTYDSSQISLRKLAELLATLGYAPKIQLDDLKPDSGSQKKKLSAEEKKLYFKIGITGFAFGNIMLLSFPEYLDWVGTDYQNFFGYLNILLALPVFFYCSSDYLLSAFKALRAKTINLDVPISMGIIVLFGRSLYEILTHTGAGFMDSLAGLIFFLLVGKWFQSKTYQSLSFERDYKSYFPLAVQLKQRKGQGSKPMSSIPVTDIKKNDHIIIRNQELIPADSILLSEDAFIDYSFVTGEAEPIHKRQGDYLYAGGRQVGASITLEVQKEVAQSYLTQLWNNDVFSKDGGTQKQFQQKVARFSQYFTLVVLAIAFGAALYWNFTNPAKIWNTFTAVLIVACPCALALSMPFTLGNTMRIFGRNRLYLKNAEVVADLAGINHLVFDKTGTITHPNETKISFDAVQNQGLSPEQALCIASLVKHSTHPLSQRIFKHLNIQNLAEAAQFNEIPGKGIMGIVKGTEVKVGSEQWIKGEDFVPQNVAQLQTKVFVKLGDEVLGGFVMQHEYRQGLGKLIQGMQSHYGTSLISGDNDAEAERLKSLFGQQSILKFQQKPADKLAFINDLQQEGKQVMMMGDGLNDAGALQQSHVGIAVSEDTSSFSPACDAILDARVFDKLPRFLKFSKTSLKVVKMSFVLSLLYNLIGVAFAVSGNLSPVVAAILMPLSSITVVSFVIVTTNALAKYQGLVIGDTLSKN
ncbi:heavy metal translocating P-type ATPase [Microscilla marina]|uniref:E1-E2 ATPase subfamily, putative n=1 Tax=Microscilla marina ATCC 23134 TaxID=313606 RepID=A1ZF91_MICM2|nr:heavy metal translocating P-type ATPase metal-binding domain-containing protein [Microscilla marina]EAY31193.1 E1-E2 ATPase subfamily, putative [Microscilla marina ATCC 23134]